MSASNEDGLPSAPALDETSALLTASPESMAQQVPDVTYPELPPSGCYDAREASAATPLPPNLRGETLGVTFHTRTDGDFRLVKLADIAIGERLRGVVDAFINTIVQSTSTHDVIQPPVVRPDLLNRGKFILVSGLQRINAAHLRGKDEVLCRVAELTDLQAALWEIDENLVRAPLSPAEEAIFIDRRRELHEQIHGKAKALGAVAANAVMGRKHATAKMADASFTADTAKKTGKSLRAIQRVVQRAAQNGRTDLARIVGTSLDRGAELDALPLVSPATRDALIEQATAGIEVSAVQARKEQQKPTAQEESSNTAAALRQQSSQTPGLVATYFIDNDLSALKAAWNNASKAVREKFLEWIDEHQSKPDYRS
jgi:ParB/RepB/Spo0J family partition protein